MSLADKEPETPEGWRKKIIQPADDPCDVCRAQAPTAAFRFFNDDTFVCETCLAYAREVLES